MTLPQGTYTGRVHGLFRPLNLFWRGKVFQGDKAWNRILGGLFVEGWVGGLAARLPGHEGPVFIDYPQLGLTDVLHRRKADAEIWDGSMALGWLVVYFTLTKEAE